MLVIFSINGRKAKIVYFQDQASIHLSNL